MYVQTLGSADPADRTTFMASSRVARGELWLGGLAYGSLFVAQEITPTVLVNIAVIANLTDPSALLIPGLTWSVSENADLSIGGFLGLGERPQEFEPTDLLNESGGFRSEEELLDLFAPPHEFGAMPSTAFVKLGIYF